jgi:hypothetical protein
MFIVLRNNLLTHKLYRSTYYYVVDISDLSIEYVYGKVIFDLYKKYDKEFLNIEDVDEIGNLKFIDYYSGFINFTSMIDKDFKLINNLTFEYRGKRVELTVNYTSNDIVLVIDKTHIRILTVSEFIYGHKELALGYAFVTDNFLVVSYFDNRLKVSTLSFDKQFYIVFDLENLNIVDIKVNGLFDNYIIDKRAIHDNTFITKMNIMHRTIFDSINRIE